MNARKGDLVLVEHTERTYGVGNWGAKRTTYSHGVVASVTRTGLVESWHPVGYADQIVMARTAHPSVRLRGVVARPI